MIRKSIGMMTQALALSAFASIAALALPLQAVADDTVYDFSGSCSDCQNTGNGVLTLQNYTPGALLNGGNFVSFTYSSNLVTFNITQSELDFTAVTYTGSTFTFVSGPTTTSIGLTGSLGATAGPADFYLDASTTQGNGNYSVDFDSCRSNCDTNIGLIPNEWGINVQALANDNFPGGRLTKTNDYGFSHTWTPVSAVAAPEMDANSAAGAIVLLMSALAILGGRKGRSLQPIR